MKFKVTKYHIHSKFIMFPTVILSELHSEIRSFLVQPCTSAVQGQKSKDIPTAIGTTFSP